MILRGENLIKEYGPKKVVKGVSLEVQQGEIVGLLGPNGAGKTTSFYMIVGLVKPTWAMYFWMIRISHKMRCTGERRKESVISRRKLRFSGSCLLKIISWVFCN
jgi:ABC-type lipopolysaccharide export system ATPase subunit